MNFYIKLIIAKNYYNMLIKFYKTVLKYYTQNLAKKWFYILQYKWFVLEKNKNCIEKEYYFKILSENLSLWILCMRVRILYTQLQNLSILSCTSFLPPLRVYKIEKIL